VNILINIISITIAVAALGLAFDHKGRCDIAERELGASTARLVADSSMCEEEVTYWRLEAECWRKQNMDNYLRIKGYVSMAAVERYRKEQWQEK